MIGIFFICLKLQKLTLLLGRGVGIMVAVDWLCFKRLMKKIQFLISFSSLFCQLYFIGIYFKFLKRLDSCYFFVFLIIIGVRANLRTPWLIPRTLRFTANTYLSSPEGTRLVVIREQTQGFMLNFSSMFYLFIF